MYHRLTENELAVLLFLAKIDRLPGTKIAPGMDNDALATLEEKGYIHACPEGHRLSGSVIELLEIWKDILFIIERAGTRVQIGILASYEKMLCYHRRNGVYDLFTMENTEELIDEQICQLIGLPQLPNRIDHFYLRMTLEEGKRLLEEHTEEELLPLQRKYGIPTVWFERWWTVMMGDRDRKKITATVYDIKKNREIQVVFLADDDAIYLCANEMRVDPYFMIAKGGTDQIVSLLYDL